ncbi:MAG: hypothetical protein MI922_02025, partial [Bacteroidales bacterium]|nr:hypothetical protein [Bacteroidales bacterium]
NKIFINTKNEWYNPSDGIVPGTLMIRPVFGRYIAPEPGETAAVKSAKLKIVPNPARTSVQLHFTNKIPVDTQGNWYYVVIDNMGRKVAEQTWDENSIDVGDYPMGLYHIRLINRDTGDNFNGTVIKTN